MVIKLLKKLEYANVYVTDSFEHKAQVITDLEEQHRVVIISSQEDVVSYFGLILQQYGQYNVYLEEDLSIVDDEYLEEVSKRDRPKEEAIIFLGKPLSEMINETIDELHLNDKQKRIMSLCKEVIRGTDDTKSRATISHLNDKLNSMRIDLENTKEELKQYQTKGSTNIDSSVIHVSTFNLDNIFSKTRIMYIREYSRVNYLDSLLVSYVNYLEKMCRKKVKMIIIDDKSEYSYTKYPVISTVDEYLAARRKFSMNNIIMTKIPITPMITDLYKSDSYDIIIILDKNVPKNNLIRGKNVKVYSAVYYKENLNYVLEKTKDTKLITDIHLEYKDSIVIPEIKELNQPDIDENTQMYYYKQLINAGEDKRLLFEILNEDNKMKEDKI